VVKAFVVGRYGSKDGLQIREVPEPGIGARDVLVAVRAASVNLLDAKIRDGEFKRILPYRVPFALGHDLAGRVMRVGSAVRSFAPGDEVYARPSTDHIGTFAELAAVHEADLAVKPATLTMEESAALPLVALTAWPALVERAHLQPGQKTERAKGKVVVMMADPRLTRPVTPPITHAPATLTQIPSTERHGHD
jgi:NADPH:quinone reductase-like Zn-dependent oxidoreductase